ncbi:alpha/beta superfamily hydrolase [Mannheimia varigena USDA-ARS-USMARC-1312]|nr:alpha/beta superfamily hydrolase [Mannheimia varigena USDA-ARS-USMARC-1312]
MIIVGIDNAGKDRLNEYGPWKTTTLDQPLRLEMPVVNSETFYRHSLPRQART